MVRAGWLGRMMGDGVVIEVVGSSEVNTYISMVRES